MLVDNVNPKMFLALIIGKHGKKNAYSDPPFSLGLLVQDVRGWTILKMVVIQKVMGSHYDNIFFQCTVCFR